MSSTTNNVEFVLTISLIENDALDFKYTYKNEDFSGPIYVQNEETISYQLIDNTGKGLRFIGAAFITPFDGVIDSVSVDDKGEFLYLLDLDKTDGQTGFQFVLTNSKNTLMVLSPDPQIINRPS